jgi:hypothetical protein
MGVIAAMSKLIMKFCAVIAMALLVFAALGPANWEPRTGFGWQTEHFGTLFTVTSITCLAWPRPFVVGAALIAATALLEGLQALTPDRTPTFLGAVWGVGGVLTAALLAELFIRVLRRRRTRWATRG